MNATEFKPISIFDLASHRLGYTPQHGGDFQKACLPMLGGCHRCEAQVAAYNSYPSKNGYIMCKNCITPDLAWTNAAEADADIFAGCPDEEPTATPCRRCGVAIDNLTEGWDFCPACFRIVEHQL